MSTDPLDVFRRDFAAAVSQAQDADVSPGNLRVAIESVLIELEEDEYDGEDEEAFLPFFANGKPA